MRVMPPPLDSSAKIHEVGPEEPPVPADEPVPPRPRGKRRILVVVAAVAALAVAGVGAHAYMTRGEESTDDAQVEADVVALAPRVGGTVAEVLVPDNAHVTAGQPLFRIDDADYQARVRQSEAELATAQAQVVAAQAQGNAARAQLSRSDAEAERAQLDLDRAEELRKGDAIAAQAFDATRMQSQTARAGVGANRAQYAAALAATELARARVQSAQAALDLARLQLSYTLIRAPANGTISRLGARVGQMVQPGQNVGQLVPDATYVVGNFKETQTGAIRPGEQVDVAIDAYPGRTLHGRVESISSGTGARFALLPPDNASGNFVKVVERVPVRIAWVSPPADLPLRAGLSAFVTVHTRQ
jgi:membrane fusion protein (multidrug efflux system)